MIEPATMAMNLPDLKESPIGTRRRGGWWTALGRSWRLLKRVAGARGAITGPVNRPRGAGLAPPAASPTASPSMNPTSAPDERARFMSMVSHELRTPLNAIIGFSQILRDDARAQGAAARADFAEEIHTSGVRLLHLIDEILELSVVESGTDRHAAAIVPTRRVVDHAVRAHAPTAAIARVKLDSRVDTDADRLWADERAARRALGHLVDNALKFTPAGGSVTVHARRADQWVELVVTDTGIGMTAEQRVRAFEPFWQAAPILSRRHGGTGLGLTLSRALVERQGGTVAVSSRPGVGTTVTIALPMAETAPVGVDEPVSS